MILDFMNGHPPHIFNVRLALKIIEDIKITSSTNPVSKGKKINITLECV